MQIIDFSFAAAAGIYPVLSSQVYLNAIATLMIAIITVSACEVNHCESGLLGISLCYEATRSAIP